jgi:hypothetical protein
MLKIVHSFVDLVLESVSFFAHSLLNLIARFKAAVADQPRSEDMASSYDSVLSVIMHGVGWLLVLSSAYRLGFRCTLLGLRC